ncbi:MAG: translation initiation factor IF-3 [Patescibacteria group bacterium]
MKSFQPRNKVQTKANRRNEEIRIPRLTVITDTGEKIDDIDTKVAIQMAFDRDLDLVLMSDSPPVAKIMDYGKFKYEQTKKEQASRKNQKVVETKEIRLRPKTDTHDIEIKMKKIREFIEKGHKVKLTMMFRGREAMYLDKGRAQVNQLIASVADITQIETPASYLGKRLSTILAPIKK